MTPNRTLEQKTQEVLDFASAHFNLSPGVLIPEDDFLKKLGRRGLVPQAHQMQSSRRDKLGRSLRS